MKKILVDTDVLIDYSKGYDRLLGELFVKQQKGLVELYISPVNIAEYTTDKQLNDPKRREQAAAFLDFFTIQEISRAVGFLAGSYLREGKTNYLGDALIAACAVEFDMTIVTRNKRHFRNIPGLSFF